MILTSYGSIKNGEITVKNDFTLLQRLSAKETNKQAKTRGQKYRP